MKTKLSFLKTCAAYSLSFIFTATPTGTLREGHLVAHGAKDASYLSPTGMGNIDVCPSPRTNNLMKQSHLN